MIDIKILMFITIVAAMGVVLCGLVAFLILPHTPPINSKKDLTNKKK